MGWITKRLYKALLFNILKRKYENQLIDKQPPLKIKTLMIINHLQSSGTARQTDWLTQ